MNIGRNLKMNKLSFFSSCNSHFLPTNISSNLHSCRIFRREISPLINWNSPFFICFPNNFIFYHNITEKHILNTFLFLRNLEQLIATPSNSASQVVNDGLNISLKDNSLELSQISSNDETSLNNNIKQTTK